RTLGHRLADRPFNKRMSRARLAAVLIVVTSLFAAFGGVVPATALSETGGEVLAMPPTPKVRVFGGGPWVAELQLALAEVSLAWTGDAGGAPTPPRLIERASLIRIERA